MSEDVAINRPNELILKFDLNHFRNPDGLCEQALHSAAKVAIDMALEKENVFDDPDYETPVAGFYDHSGWGQFHMVDWELTE